MGHEEIIELARSHGMQGVELRGKSAEEHISPETPPQRRREIRALYERAGVAIAGITGYSKFCYTDEARLRESRADVARYAALCQEMGAEYLRFYIGALEEGVTFEQLLPSLAENFDRISQENLHTGVKLLVEMHDSLLTGAQAQAIFSRMRTHNGNVGVIWDTGSPFFGGEAPQETWQRLGSLVGAVHLRDVVPTPEGKRRQVMAGEGVLPLREQIETLRRAGYAGWYCIKWERVFDPALAPVGEALDSFRTFALACDTPAR